MGQQSNPKGSSPSRENVVVQAVDKVIDGVREGADKAVDTFTQILSLGTLGGKK